MVLLTAAITTFVLNTWKIMGIVILLIWFLLLYARDAKNGSRKKKSSFLKVISYALFTQLPIRENEAPYISSSAPIRYSLKQKNCTKSSSDKEKEDNDEGSKKARR